MNNKKKLVIAVSVIVLVALIAVLYFAVLAPKAQEGTKAITLEIVADGETKTISAKTDAAFLENLLVELQEKGKLTVDLPESTYGKFINAVNGRVADADKFEYWAVYVNGEYGQNGVSTEPVVDGTTYRLVLETWA